MCGIVGIIGKEDVSERVVEGLRRLEYRGYDSAGIATISEGHIGIRRAKGKLCALTRTLQDAPLAGSIGIGHTRWATHGPATEANAHPHVTDRVAVVHNGIIENYRALKDELIAQGALFSSETDTEVIAHLLTKYLDETNNIHDAAQKCLARLQGAYAVAILFKDYPDQILAARAGSPLAIGFGDEETFIGSDSFALAPYTNKVCYLHEGDWAIITQSGAAIFSQDGTSVERPIEIVDSTQAMVDKGGYRHYMAKEIHEQPDVLSRTFGQYIDTNNGVIRMPEHDIDLSQISRVMLVACGTAYFAALVGRNWIERYARIPTSIDIASEFRYRELPLSKDTLMVFVSQSGETADTLAAMRYCKELNLNTIGIVNVPASSLAREVCLTLPTYAGPEIGVASTKAFTAQVGTLAALSIYLGRLNGSIEKSVETELCEALITTPRQAVEVLANEDDIMRIANEISDCTSALFIGRGTAHPLALEGALKLKEISYIHAEGFAAGELKHGSIALIDEDMPIVTIAPDGALFDKTISNMQEVMARKGKVYLIASQAGVNAAGEGCDGLITMPQIHPFTAPIIYALPLQLLAYHTACIKGTDVDQPRNLAKSVTVE
jgi:glutamine---fructose-6-phosphate transaminase (isomerizing)